MGKEKKLLFISSIIMAIYVVLSLIYDTSLINKERTLGLDIYNAFIYGSSIIGIAVFMYFSLKKDLELDNYRGIIILISVFFFLYNIISGILGFIVVSKIEKKKKRELPVLKIEHTYKSYVYILAFLVCMGIMFGLSRLFTNKYQMIGSYIFMFIMLVIIFRNDLKRDFAYFKEYFREYNSYVLKMYLKSFLVLFILTMSIKISTGLDNSTNQVSLNEMFSNKPYFVAILAMIYAPIAEELMFRGCFRKIIKNKWIFIIISGLLFGLAHIIDDFNSMQELLYIFVYGSLGCFLATIYYRTNNLFCNIYFHFIQNTLAIVAMFLLTFLTK